MDEQVLVAELVDEWPGNKASATCSLNAALGATIAVVLVFLLMSRVIELPLSKQQSKNRWKVILQYLRDICRIITEDQNSYVLKMVL